MVPTIATSEPDFFQYFRMDSGTDWMNYLLRLTGCDATIRNHLFDDRYQNTWSQTQIQTFYWSTLHRFRQYKCKYKALRQNNKNKAHTIEHRGQDTFQYSNDVFLIVFIRKLVTRIICVQSKIVAWALLSTIVRYVFLVLSTPSSLFKKSYADLSLQVEYPRNSKPRFCFGSSPSATKHPCTCIWSARKWLCLALFNDVCCLAVVEGSTTDQALQPMWRSGQGIWNRMHPIDQVSTIDLSGKIWYLCSTRRNGLQRNTNVFTRKPT